MPGLPFYNNYSNAGAPVFDIDQAPLSSRVSPRLAFELRRMPLHHVVAQNRYHGATAGFPLGRENRNNSAICAPTLAIFEEQLTSARHGSADSEHDLAAMVLDFMENGSVGSDFPDSSDGENGLPNCSRLLETLQALKFNASLCEKELLSILSMFFLSSKEKDLFCIAECNGACIKRMLVKHFRQLGYDAMVCSSKWANSDKLPGGEYEYVHVLFKREKDLSERVIVDIDFQSQFEIARPTHSYAAALKFLPVIFIGSEEKLRQVLQVMAEAAKMSLKQNSMPLPPWRTLDYMSAKWFSPFERIMVDFEGNLFNNAGKPVWTGFTRTRQCLEQLRHLKVAIAAEMDKNHMLKPMNLERNRAMYFAQTNRLSMGSTFPDSKNHALKVSALDTSE